MTGSALPWPAGITQERAADILLEYADMLADCRACKRLLLMAWEDWRIGERQRGRIAMPESDLQTALSQVVAACRGAA